MKLKISPDPLRALWPCAVQSCAEEVSWPASDLYWCAEYKAWICASCLEYLELEPGRTLKDWLLTANPPIIGFL